VSAVSSIDLQLVCTRRIPCLDTETLEPRQAKEALFRNGNRYMLYLSDGAPPSLCEERVIALSLREALLWLNETQTDAGSFWE
jgi:hypothetical protein